MKSLRQLLSNRFHLGRTQTKRLATTSAAARAKTEQPNDLKVETLEDRILLSTVQLIAAGAEGGEQMDLQIDGNTVQSWTVSAGADSGQFQTYTWNTPTDIAAGQVRIRFTNDVYDPANNIDQDLRVDAIVIDGQRFETEDPSVFSTGTWTASGLEPGFLQSEYLHSNGYFQFDGANNTGSTVEVRARGDEGGEQFRLQIGGVTVGTYTTTTFDQTFSYTAASNVTADQVRIEFFGDVYDPGNGIDTNVNVDYIAIDGTRFQTEAPTTFSTGTWLEADGVQPGFRESETLTSDGYFQYLASGNSGSDIQIRARGDEGGEQFQLQINGSAVASFEVTTSNQTFSYTASGNVSADQVRIAFVNDIYDPGAGIDANLVVDYLRIDGTTYQTEAPTTFSTGTWLPADGITPGFRQSETLHGEGYFQYLAGSASFGTIGWASGPTSVNEADGSVQLSVQRTNGSDGTVTIDYNTQPTGATPGGDFTPVSGTLTFAPGQTSGTISIPILDDNLVEQPESFGVTLDNPGGGATLLVPRTIAVTIIDNESPLPNYSNFNSVSGLDLNGGASQSGSALQLTSNTTNQAGSAFFETPIVLSDDAHFRSTFSFRATGGSGGADGLTFTVQNDPAGASAIGSSGGSLGYSGIDNSIAVEFDTYVNGGDINDNHVSIITGSVGNSLRTANPGFDINSGSRYYAWVEYNGISDVLAVYVSENSSKPTVALMTTKVDLEQLIGSAGYFGFTAGTGGLTNAHQIASWSVDQQAPPQLPSTNPGSNVVATDVIDSGLVQPIAIDWLPDGTMLIAEKGGVVRSSFLGTLESTPFIDISPIVNGVRDRGLLDIAVHPDFENNPYVYLLFTYDPPEVFNFSGDSGPDGKNNRAGRLIRVTADASNNYRTAVAGSEVVLLGKNSTWANFNGLVNSTNDFNEPPAGELPGGGYLEDFIPSDSESHTVGGLAFAPDGNLFVSIGDGASYNRVDVRADRVQDIDSLSGKILRIDPITGRGVSDNPFYDGDPDANRSKVYQLGLRNPYRISVDSATGQLFIGDVGWVTWEEVNAAGPGANFGWPFYEGGSGTSSVQTSYANTPEGQAFFAGNPSVDASIYALNHSADGINAIVMGDVYRGNQYGSDYVGDVFFNDLGQGIVRHASLDANGNVTSIDTFATGAQIVVSISQGPDGLLYYVDLDDGDVGRWEII